MGRCTCCMLAASEMAPLSGTGIFYAGSPAWTPELDFDPVALRVAATFT